MLWLCHAVPVERPYYQFRAQRLGVSRITISLWLQLDLAMQLE